jgi:hypothetical protein
MNSLYRLSLVLTANHALAEECFVRALDDATNGNPVFGEWAQSWARRMIVRNATKMIRPRLADGGDVSKGAMGEAAEIARIVKMPAFERFVFVMSVLERYSDRECSLLLECTRGELVEARIRAFEEIGR